ncbi:hypothetical protein V7R84_07475 [Arachnia propionica]|uniref:hypothetical protein n=1 Tax=Arachnia propionica TaxID=1750 RepID=UPI0030CEACB6
MSQTSDDIVDADTGDTPIVTNHRVLVLRALRISGLIAFLVALLLACPWWDGFPVPRSHVNQLLLFGTTLPFLWLLGCRKGASKVWFACLVIIDAVPLAAFQVYRWWLFHSLSSVSVALFLALALLAFGLGLFIVADLLLRALRDRLDISHRDPANPARFRPLRDTNATSRWRGRLRRLSLVAGAVVVLVAPVFLAPALTGPVSTTATAPEGDLPARPTTIGSEVTWRQDVRGLIDVTAGAAGPILLTKDGVTALNPGDGTVLWSYRRSGASYLMIHSSVGDSAERPFSHMVTSPTGRHVALRVMGPKELDQTAHADRDASINAVTIVIDTLTGQVTGEHLSNDVWRLQLSDSAVLDGTTAYSLKDGQKLWSFTGKYGYAGYSGPAGHTCFVATNHKQTNGPHVSTRITLTPDSAIRTDSKRASITVDADAEGLPVLVNGWTVQPKNPDDALRTDEGESWEAQAISLDSLIGFAEEEPVDLGRITGVYHEVSHRSGVIRTSESIFDPATRTVTPLSQYPGPAGATAGIDATIQEGKQTGAFVIRPSDGSAGITVPIEPGSFPVPLAGKKPAPLTVSGGMHEKFFLSAPGVTLMAINPMTGSNDYSNSSSTKHGYTRIHTYRLYGVAGGSA